MEENMEDRISELPECIVHHILSFLNSPAQLVRVSVLSKKWLALTASFPILDFNIYGIDLELHAPGIPIDSVEYRRYAKEKFFEYVAYTMSRFCEQNVSAHTFKLNAELDQEPLDVEIFDRWIGLIVDKDVKVFDIRTRPKLREYFSPEPLFMYCLPNTLLSASSLTSLTIHGCALPSSLMDDDVKFKALKLLSLDRVPIDEEVINYLTTSCPLLEEFNVEHCNGFKRFCVYGLQSLQKVRIFFEHEVERIDIEAPNLNYLCLTMLKGRGAPCINLASCKKLTTLSFHGDSSSISKWFTKFLSNFPLIENLFLKIPTQYNNLKVSSHSLRKFVLNMQYDLDGIEIDAPSLLLFEYSGDSHPGPFRFASTSAQLKACMDCYLNYNVDTLCFWKLRRFLDRSNGFKVLKLHITTASIDVDKLKLIRSPPFELEHVELKLDIRQDFLVNVAVMDAVLWCCCPRSLTLRPSFPFTDSEEQGYVVMVTYEKLLQQEDQHHTNIQIVLSSASTAKKHFRDLSSLLKALPRDRRGQVVTFIKEGGTLF